MPSVFSPFLTILRTSRPCCRKIEPKTLNLFREFPKNLLTRREYIYASVPYVKGTSERLQRVFKSHEITLVHKPFNSLRSQLVRVKDRTENLKKCGTVCHIHCEQCDKDYVGETSRLLETRVKEHLSGNSPAVHEHCRLTGHSVDSSKAKVLATENNTFKRRIREAIEISFEQRQWLRISQHL